VKEKNQEKEKKEHDNNIAKYTGGTEILPSMSFL
jgi:hypothetical protein